MKMQQREKNSAAMLFYRHKKSKGKNKRKDCLIRGIYACSMCSKYNQHTIKVDVNNLYLKIHLHCFKALECGHRALIKFISCKKFIELVLRYPIASLEMFYSVQVQERTYKTKKEIKVRKNLFTRYISALLNPKQPDPVLILLSNCADIR